MIHVLFYDKFIPATEFNEARHEKYIHTVLDNLGDYLDLDYEFFLWCEGTGIRKPTKVYPPLVNEFVKYLKANYPMKEVPLYGYFNLW